MCVKRTRNFLGHAHFIKTTHISLPSRAAACLQTAPQSGEWFLQLAKNLATTELLILWTTQGDKQATLLVHAGPSWTLEFQVRYPP